MTVDPNTTDKIVGNNRVFFEHQFTVIVREKVLLTLSKEE